MHWAPTTRKRAYAILSTVIGGSLFASCGPPPGHSTPLGTTVPCPERRPAVETTLQAIMAGRFPTARDKIGTCGTLVTVRNLKVLRVVSMDDGDWHVEVTDDKVPIFISELIPADQAREGMPPAGKRIDETGFAYDDMQSDGEHHQFTPWEIHPIVNWTLSASPPTP